MLFMYLDRTDDDLPVLAAPRGGRETRACVLRLIAGLTEASAAAGDAGTD